MTEKIEFETLLYYLHEFQRKIAEATPEFWFVRLSGGSAVRMGTGRQDA